MSRLRGLLAFQFALLAIGAVAASSAQADGYVSVKDRYVAPTWTGCYIGYDDGYKWGRTRFSTPPTYTLNNPTATVATPSTNGIEHLHTNGFLLGGQFGCNYQIKRDLVIGFEVSGTRDWGKDSANSALTAGAAAPRRSLRLQRRRCVPARFMLGRASARRLAAEPVWRRWSTAPAAMPAHAIAPAKRARFSLPPSPTRACRPTASTAVGSRMPM